MARWVSRRRFLQTTSLTAAGAGLAGSAAVAASSAETAPADQKIKIIGIACSPRKGKTTAQAVRVALEAAKAVAPDRIEVELIELADLEIPGYVAAGIPLKEGQRDDFPPLAEKLADKQTAGIIVGSPVYFGCMSYLCKAFFDRCIVLRKQFALSGKVGGAVAVGAGRNGGQELTLQAIRTVLSSHEMVLVGDGKPTAHWGATVWNNGKDDITQDEMGMATLKNLGRRVAEVALACR
ncbi:MAG TPA: flavodoxin family protein [Thermoguttaceae bacterium]|nr:flavodoxin family protein [Thermoguttaceae bacterium]HPP52592.1 flavodoxin family protein [Thermoguttaceae bacterium]